MVISGKTAVQQLEELLVLMINSFEGVKDVIRFMSFEELEIVGFENKMINLKVNSNQLNETIGISNLDEQQSIEKSDEDDDKTLEKESFDSDIEPDEIHKIYNKTKKTREKLNKENKAYDKLETTSIIEGIKKNEALRMRESNMDEEINSLAVNDAFAKFSKTNHMKGREPKIHMRKISPVENENEENKSNLNEKKVQIKPINEIQEFVFPIFDDVEMNSSNIEEFLSKHWIELMDV